MSFKKIDAKSAETVTSALDIFSIPETNISATHSSVVEFLPTNPVKESPIHFNCSSGGSFYDLQRSYLFTEFELKVKKGEEGWRTVNEGDKCSVIQALGSTFMQTLRISLNSQELYHSNSLQHYKSYVDLLLNFGHDATASHLTAVGWYDTKEFGTADDLGFKKRRGQFTKGKQQFVTRIFADLFQIPQYLLNHCTLDIEITPHKNLFCIEECDNAGLEYSLELKKCKLYMKTVTLSDGVGIGIATSLTKNPCIYPLKKSTIKSLFVSTGRRDFVATLYSEQIPRRVILGLVKHSSAQDSSKENPFEFVHGNVSAIALSAGGQNYPNVPFNIDYAGGDFVRVYHEMQEALNFGFTNSANTISREMFKNGFALYVFNLTTTLEDNDCLDLIRRGPTTLSIQFAKPVPTSGYSIIAIAEHDSLLFIDNHRQISTDLTP